MKTDIQLLKDVEDALRWERHLSSSDITVVAKDGVVILSGKVNTFSKRQEAEDATKSVKGVKAVVEKIAVNLNGDGKFTDIDIANNLIRNFSSSWRIPKDLIKIKVEEGWITASGTVHWNYQREAAKSIIQNAPGVKGLTNDVIVVSDHTDVAEKKEIEKALERSWSINSDSILVNVQENKVILKGKVSSLYAKEEATRIAWNAKGVWEVDNQLEVTW